MFRVSDFLKERNKKIIARYNDLKLINKRNEAINIVAAEFSLSNAAIDSIIYPRRKRTKIVPKA